MAKSLLKPVNTGGLLVPWLDYRIMQQEQCIVEYYDAAKADMELAGLALDVGDYGVANDWARKAHRKLSVLLETSKAHRELKWVQQHPKYNNERKDQI
jgi:hypothetical protein